MAPPLVTPLSLAVMVRYPEVSKCECVSWLKMLLILFLGVHDSDSVQSDVDEGPSDATLKPEDPCVVVQPVLQELLVDSELKGDDRSGTMSSAYHQSDREGSGSRGDGKLQDEGTLSNGIGQSAPPNKDLVAKILRKMWEYSGAYTINNAVSAWNGHCKTSTLLSVDSLSLPLISFTLTHTHTPACPRVVYYG